MKRDQGLTRLAPARRDRIVFMASTLPMGGTEIHLLDLMKGSGSLGFEPHLLLLKEPGPLGERVIADGSVRVVYGLKKRGVTPGLLRRIYTELRRIDPVLDIAATSPARQFFVHLAFALHPMRCRRRVVAGQGDVF